MAVRVSPEPVVPAAPGLPLPSRARRAFRDPGRSDRPGRIAGAVQCRVPPPRLPCVLVPMRVPPADLETAFKGLWTVANLDGLVLTVPHKIDVLRFVDELGPTARRMGPSTPSERLPDGRLLGEIFDGAASYGGLHGRGFTIAGRSILIVGCGGAGTAIAFAVAEQRPGAMHLFDVDPVRAADLARRIGESHPDLPIHAGDRDPAAWTGGQLYVARHEVGDAVPVELDRMDSRTGCRRYRAQAGSDALPGASGCPRLRDAYTDPICWRAKSARSATSSGSIPFLFLTRCEIRSHPTHF